MYRFAVLHYVYMIYDNGYGAVPIKGAAPYLFQKQISYESLLCGLDSALQGIL